MVGQSKEIGGQSKEIGGQSKRYIIIIKMSSWSYLLSGKVEYTRKQLSGIDTVGNGCLLHSLSRTSLDTHSLVFKGKLGGYSFGNSWHSQLILVLFVLDNPPRQNDSSSNCNRVFVFLYT